jgi:hypothetical protein
MAKRETSEEEKRRRCEMVWLGWSGRGFGGHFGVLGGGVDTARSSMQPLVQVRWYEVLTRCSDSREGGRQIGLVKKGGAGTLRRTGLDESETRSLSSTKTV